MLFHGFQHPGNVFRHDRYQMEIGQVRQTAQFTTHLWPKT